jgi:hypothetical protein
VTYLESYFDACFRHLRVTAPTQAYIVGVFVAQAVRPVDYSQLSVVTTYAAVARTYNMFEIQSLADWILWTDSMYVDAFEEFRDLNHAIAQSCYYRCFQLVNGAWPLYEELAESLPELIPEIRQALAIQGQS